MDVDKILFDVLNKTKKAFGELITEEVPAMLDAVEVFLQNAERRYGTLLKAMAGGANVKYLLDHLEAEKDIFKSEVLSFIVILKVAAQTLFNLLQDILLTAVRLVLPTNAVR